MKISIFTILSLAACPAVASAQAINYAAWTSPLTFVPVRRTTGINFSEYGGNGFKYLSISRSVSTGRGLANVNFPFSNPVIMNGKRLRLIRFLMNFKTNAGGVLNGIYIYDGGRLLKSFSELNVSGDYSGRLYSIETPDLPYIYGGLSVHATFALGAQNAANAQVFSLGMDLH